MNTLNKYLEENGITPKEKTKPTKKFQNLSAAEKWALVESLLIDLGYIDHE